MTHIFRLALIHSRRFISALLTLGLLAGFGVGNLQKLQAQTIRGRVFGESLPSLWVPDLQTLNCPWFYFGEDFDSFISLKNTTDKQLNVYLSVAYGANEAEDGIFNSNEPIKLAGGEARNIDLKLFRDQNHKVFKGSVSGGLELMFIGNPSDVIAKTSVLSAKRHISFDVPFTNPSLTTTTTLDSILWFIGQDYHSYVQLKNTTSEDVIVTLTVRFGKGMTEYSFSVPARQSRAIDLRELKPILGKAVSGSAELRHSGAPGAIVANLTFLSLSQGLSFASPFVPRTATKD